MEAGIARTGEGVAAARSALHDLDDGDAVIAARMVAALAAVAAARRAFERIVGE